MVNDNVLDMFLNGYVIAAYGFGLGGGMELGNILYTKICLNGVFFPRALGYYEKKTPETNPV